MYVVSRLRIKRVLLDGIASVVIVVIVVLSRRISAVERYLEGLKSKRDEIVSLIMWEICKVRNERYSCLLSNSMDWLLGSFYSVFLIFYCFVS